MIRFTLNALLLSTSMLLVSCNTGLPDVVSQGSTTPSSDEPSNNITPNAKPAIFASSNSQDSQDSSDDSVAGLWDLSDQVDVVYQYWTDNDTYTIYDYQGDGDGTGENCYELEEVDYTRDGNTFNYAGGTHKVTRDANTLTIDGVPFPLIISLSVVDLNVCI